VLDGDIMRDVMNDHDMTHGGRTRSILRAAHIARLINQSGVMAIVAKITPAAIQWEALDNMRRGGFGHFRVYCDASLEERVKRDPKDLYKLAVQGTITELTGYDGHYFDPSESVELIVNTERMCVTECVTKILQTACVPS
jgi:adenylylsulfate kinase-like enzyme